MFTYIGILHFGLEFCVFLASFAISYVSWQLYIRDRQRTMMAYAFGFALIGISGVIHSFNLTAETYLEFMFAGRIGGYCLILWAVSHPSQEGLKTPKKLFLFTPVVSSYWILYLINVVLTAMIALRAYKERTSSRAVFAKYFSTSFVLISISEFFFAFSKEGDFFWITAHFFKITGYAILLWAFLRLPKLRIVDKLHVVLRGLVLFSVIVAIIPVTILMLYNIRQDAFDTAGKDARRVLDYIEKDKQRLLNTTQIIAYNPTLIDLLEKRKSNSIVPETTIQLREVLRETGNNFVIILDTHGNSVLALSDKMIRENKFNNLWLVEKSLQGQKVVEVQENFIFPLTLVSAGPIRKGNQIIGVVMTGLHINDSYLKGMKKSIQRDINIFHGDTLAATTYDLSPAERKINIWDKHPEILRRVLEDKLPYPTESKFRGQTFYASLAPLLGHQQQVLGIIFTGIPALEFESRKSEILVILILVSIPVTLLAWFIGARFSRNITQSVESLGNAAQNVAQGNLDIKITTESGDELAELARLFNQMVTKLKEIDTMKSDFYSFISHEIRTPLTALRGASETIIETGTSALSPDQNKMLQIISQNAQRLSRLVDSLLQLAKLEAGKMEFAKTPLNLNSIITKSLETFEPIARNKKIQLKNNIPQNLPSPTGDPDWMTQVLNNLVSNAIKFTPDGGLVTVSASHINHIPLNNSMEVQELIEVRVQDTGIGIPKEELGHMFDKYHQVRSSLSDTVKGTGLGLSICKHIIEEAHHGRIWAESEQGKGSTFIFTLPLNTK